MKSKHILIGVQILLLVAFSVISLGLATSQGLCCADDAYHAMVAKNLANGHGFASSLPLGLSHSTWQLFDPYLGTGPTILLPAALLIKLAGNTYWAPGASNILLWSVLLLCIGIVLNKMIQNKAWLTIACLTFFVLALLLTAYHFEQWYALLGEIPTALFIILGVLIYFLPGAKTKFLVTGLLFSVAFEAKIVALLPIGTFILFIVIHQLLNHRNNIRSAVSTSGFQILWIGMGFAIPVFLFEIYRLVSLHPAGYVDYWIRSIQYIGKEGVVVNQGFLEKIAARIVNAKERFGLFLPIVFLLFAGIWYALRNDKQLRPILASMLLLIATYSIYWLVISIGWARYYIIALLMIIFTLALPLVSELLKPIHKAVYGLILLGLILFNIMSIDIAFPFRNTQLFRPSQNTLALEQVSALLGTKTSEKPYLTEWWATAIDVEYILKSELNFTTLYDPNNSLNRPYIIVVNTKFQTDPGSLADFEKGCTSESIGRYDYLECNPMVSP